MSKTIQYKVQVDTGNSVKTLGQLESELAQINEELQDVAIGSDRFKELSRQSQQVTRDLEQVNQQVEGFTADKKFQAADGAIKIAAGSLQSFVGGLGLLGIESEALGEFEQKAASAIAVGIGLKDLSEGVGQLAPLFKQSGIAAKLFGTTARTAITATGIGVFVIALGTVVAYWDDIVAGVKKAANAFPFVGKAIDAIKDAFNSLIERFKPLLRFLGILPSEAEVANKAIIKSNEAVIDVTEREIAVLQAKGAKQEEIFKAKEKQLQLELENLKRNGAEAEEIYKKETELLVLQAQEAKRVADEKAKATEEANKKIKEANEKAKAEADKLAEEEKQKKEKEAKEAIDRENKRVEDIAKILEDYRQKQKDIDAETNVEKVNLEEERKIAELEALKATEEEKEAIRAFYRERRKEAEDLDEEERVAKEQENAQKAADAIMKTLEDEYMAAQEKIAIRAMVVDAIAGLTNQETLIGKAAFIAQQIIRLQDLKATATASLKKIAIDAGASTADVSKGFAATLKAGFPQNVPFLIAYAAQAASVIAATTSAFSKAKSTIGGIGGSGGGNIQGPRTSGFPQISSVAAPSTPTTGITVEEQAAAQQVAQGPQVIEAYVLEGNVTSAQEASSKIRQRRRVGA